VGNATKSDEVKTGRAIWLDTNHRRKIILSWKSAMLRHCTIESGETAALLQVRQRTYLGGIAL
jgi:hypothetical protein